MKNSMKVMVIGLDGATFDILDPLIQEGKLPHLKEMIQKGSRGILKSTMPPASPAAWSTFQSGKEPGNHGIFDFFRNCPENYSYTPVNSTFLKTKTLWEILSDHGRRVGVMNLLFTYPPSKVNGFIVSGKETPSEDRDYTFPTSLKAEILKFEPKYKIEPFHKISISKESLKTVPDDLNRQERVNCYLYEQYPCDVFMNLFGVPDIIHHLFWKYMDPSHPHYNAKEAAMFLPLIERCFQTLDEIIGRRLKMIDNDTVVIVMSDHGGGPLHKIVQLNKWLQDQGLQATKQSYGGINRLVIFHYLKKVRRELIKVLKKYAKPDLIRALRRKSNRQGRDFVQNALIDWSKTKAYAGRLSEQGIYLNLKGREREGIVNSGAEYDEIRQLIISRLSELRDSGGQKVFERIYRREEIYNGPYISYAPDIMIDFGDFPYQAGDDLLGQELFQVVNSDGVTGMHRRNGIFIAHGANIRKEAEIYDANICDLAPTILYLMGEPIPGDMDGKVLFDLFEKPFLLEHPFKKDADTSKVKQTDEEVTYTPEELASLEDRLRRLGYL